MKLTVYHRQHDSTYEKIRILESLIKCRKFEWTRSVQTLQLQDKLYNAREEISMLQRALNGKKTFADFKDVPQRSIQVTAPIADVGSKELLLISHNERSWLGEREPEG